jgi:hypothetical protein
LIALQPAAKSHGPPPIAAAALTAFLVIFVAEWGDLTGILAVMS